MFVFVDDDKNRKRNKLIQSKAHEMIQSVG